MCDATKRSHIAREQNARAAPHATGRARVTHATHTNRVQSIGPVG